MAGIMAMAIFRSNKLYKESDIMTHIEAYSVKFLRLDLKGDCKDKKTVLVSN